jgi:hypothetical protein
MEDKQNIYLDKVIEFLLRDTKIDYKNEKITTPSNFIIHFIAFFLLIPSFLPFTFSKYSKEVYGLTDQEIEYVWKEYKEIIKDKIKNGR